jgi:hypothetical protein
VISAFNCRANVSGMCANFEPVPWYPSLYLKQLNKILIKHLTILTTRLYCRRGINRLVIFNHLATDSSHISWLRFRIKFIFHPKQTELVEVRNQIQAMALLSKTVSHFLHTLMNEQVLDIMYGWTTILYAS